MFQGGICLLSLTSGKLCSVFIGLRLLTSSFAGSSLPSTAFAPVLVSCVRYTYS